MRGVKLFLPGPDPRCQPLRILTPLPEPSGVFYTRVANLPGRRVARRRTELARLASGDDEAALSVPRGAAGFV